MREERRREPSLKPSPVRRARPIRRPSSPCLVPPHSLLSACSSCPPVFPLHSPRAPLWPPLSLPHILRIRHGTRQKPNVTFSTRTTLSRVCVTLIFERFAGVLCSGVVCLREHRMKRHCGSRSPFGSSDVSVAHSSPLSFLARVAGESRSVRTACPPPSEWSLNGRISSSQDDGALRHWCFTPEQLQGMSLPPSTAHQDR